jgi:hypothetical protein
MNIYLKKIIFYNVIEKLDINSNYKSIKIII